MAASIMASRGSEDEFVLTALYFFCEQMAGKVLA